VTIELGISPPGQAPQAKQPRQLLHDTGCVAIFIVILPPFNPQPPGAPKPRPNRSALSSKECAEVAEIYGAFEDDAVRS